MITIAFQAFYPFNKKTCRWLIVKIAELFLNNINSSTELTPFLPEGHFTYHNLNVRIGLLSKDRRSLYYPNITFIALREGEISYAKDDPQHIETWGPYKEVIYESFEEALKIVESQERPDELKNTHLL